MATYSFLDCLASLTGPGGIINLGSGSGAAKEGITIDTKEEKNAQVVGADGQIMNSLRASQAVRITVRVLKTSPVNALLSAMFNFQRQSSSVWGQNVLAVSDIARGDVTIATQVAFAKPAPITYSEDANINEWLFDGTADTQLGTGIPNRNV